MRDDPAAAEILAAAIHHLREIVLPAISGRPAFDVRICVSALELVARELSAPTDDDELSSLQTMLGADGDLNALNRRLAERIEAGGFDSDDASLIDHLRKVTLAKLAIDQPSYSGYRRHHPADTRS